MTTKEINKKSQDTSMDNAKKQALYAALAQIEKQFGKGAIMKMSDQPHEKLDVISTGALSLDIALGIGGVPRGRIIEIYGPESSGKTTLALHIVAEAQKMGGVAAYIDAEHALDPSYARSIGVDVENMFISQPDYGEQALEIAETLVRSGAMDVIVIDSVAALTPKAEIEGEMGDASIGTQARLMSQALRKLTAIASKARTTIIFLNQIRMKIGVMFGNPETTTGGNALKFYASIRMEIRKGEKITDKEGKITGNTAKVKVVKNKVAPPFKETEFDIIYPMGIDKYSSLISAAVDAGVIQKTAGWYKYGEMQLGNGKDAVKELLRSDTKLTREIIEKTKIAAGITNSSLN
ncbi:MAG: protein RecA [Candidatus Dojkabacteria bacterium]|nr:MAG: protein RecA [Candidatus Dojkabacteria bacterium]